MSFVIYIYIERERENIYIWREREGVCVFCYFTSFTNRITIKQRASASLHLDMMTVESPCLSFISLVCLLYLDMGLFPVS